MNILNIVGPVLKMLSGGLGHLGKAADEHPKAALAWTGGLAAVIPNMADALLGIASQLAAFGNWLNSVGQ
jgi:hypothetical protein